MDSGHPRGQGGILGSGQLPARDPVTWSGKDEETFVVRILMIKEGWWVMFEGDPRWRRQGSPRPRPGPLHHLPGHYSLTCVWAQFSILEERYQ